MKKISLLFLFFMLVSCSRPGEFSKNFQVQREDLGGLSTRCGLHYEDAPYRAIERCSVVMNEDLNFHVDADKPTIALVSPRECKPVDRFYCEQALWDGVECFGAEKHFGYDFKFTKSDYALGYPDCESEFLKAHPDQKGKVVVMHFIPEATSKLCHGAIGSDEIHSLRNLVGIRISDLGDRRIYELRKRWLDYIRQFHQRTPSRSEVLSEADYLYSEYKEILVY